jgi:hypothetical protein
MATGKLDKLNGEQLEAVSRCRNFLDELAQEAVDTYQEIHMSLWEGDIQILTGTADALILGGVRAALIDWKFGRGPLRETMATLQLMAYAAMAMETYNLPVIDCYIYQPRLSLGERTSHMTIDNLEQTKQTIRNILNLQAPGVLNPTPEGCQYCPGMGNCPAQFKLMEEACQTLES